MISPSYDVSRVPDVDPDVTGTPAPRPVVPRMVAADEAALARVAAGLDYGTAAPDVVAARDRLHGDGLIRRQGRGWALTAAGRAAMRRWR